MQKLAPLSVVADNRRTLTNLLQADIKDVNFYEAKRGAVLGNHYHKNTKEYFFITKGSCLVNSGTANEIVNKKSLFVVHPNTPHAIECLTDVNFLTFLSEPYDARKPDIYK